jgi:hypothetical protein
MTTSLSASKTKAVPKIRPRLPLGLELINGEALLKRFIEIGDMD